jgi:hypothetical protein
MTKSTTARHQLATLLDSVTVDLMAMDETTLDVELQAVGISPASAIAQIKAGITAGMKAARAAQREKLKTKMKADVMQSHKDSILVSPEVARQFLAKLIAANDERLTLAARNRNARDFSDDEALEVYAQLARLGAME